MRIAVFGDIHGHWCDFRDTVLQLHKEKSLDLVLQCGDAQPFRNEEDLDYMHCPKKYRKLGDFRMFYEGQEHFPLPLLFIGGNHEPWNYLDENKGGGILAPNIEFIGRFGKKKFHNIKIAGLSGVYSPKYFNAPHPPVPYPTNKRKQATYYNNTDIEQSFNFCGVDILLLHEWPSAMNNAKIENKPSHWRAVGSEYVSLVVDALKPRWIFCGHMHFPARHQHERTDIICLSDFHRDKENSFIIIDTLANINKQ